MILWSGPRLSSRLPELKCRSRPSVCGPQEAPGTAHSPLLTLARYLIWQAVWEGVHFGRFIVEKLASAGIEGVTVLPEESTGITIAFQAPERDRSFLTLLGSLKAFGASMVSEETIATDFVLFCGYFTYPPCGVSLRASS